MFPRMKCWWKSKKSRKKRKQKINSNICKGVNSDEGTNMVLGRSLNNVPVGFAGDCGYIPCVLSSAAALIEQKLRTKDIFQIQGSSTKASQIIAQLSSPWCQCQPDACVHDVIEALKLFLVRLPNPLLPEHICDELIESSQTGNDRCALILDKFRISQPANFSILNFMMKLFRKVVQESEFNNMDARKLATIFVLDVIKPLKMDDAASILACFPSERLQRLPYLIMVVEVLINNPGLFTKTSASTFRASPPRSSFKRKRNGSPIMEDNPPQRSVLTQLKKPANEDFPVLQTSPRRINYENWPTEITPLARRGLQPLQEQIPRSEMKTRVQPSVCETVHSQNSTQIVNNTSHLIDSAITRQDSNPTTLGTAALPPKYVAKVTDKEAAEKTSSCPVSKVARLPELALTSATKENVGKGNNDSFDSKTTPIKAHLKTIDELTIGRGNTSPSKKLRNRQETKGAELNMDSLRNRSLERHQNHSLETRQNQINEKRRNSSREKGRKRTPENPMNQNSDLRQNGNLVKNHTGKVKESLSKKNDYPESSKPCAQNKRGKQNLSPKLLSSTQGTLLLQGLNKKDTKKKKKKVKRPKTPVKPRDHKKVKPKANPACQFLVAPETDDMSPWKDSILESEDGSLMAKTIANPRVLEESNNQETVRLANETIKVVPSKDPNETGNQTPNWEKTTNETKVTKVLSKQESEEYSLRKSIKSQSSTSLVSSEDQYSADQKHLEEEQDFFIAQYLPKKEERETTRVLRSKLEQRLTDQTNRLNRPGVRTKIRKQPSSKAIRPPKAQVLKDKSEVGDCRRKQRRQTDTERHSSNLLSELSIKTSKDDSPFNVNHPVAETSLSPSKLGDGTTLSQSYFTVVNATDDFGALPMAHYKRQFLEKAAAGKSKSRRCGWLVDAILVAITLFCTCAVVFIYNDNFELINNELHFLSK